VFYHFKQALRLGGLRDGKDFPRGVHCLSQKEINDPSFERYVLCGFIVEAEDPKKPDSPSPLAQGEELLKKIRASRESEPKACVEEAKPEPEKKDGGKKKKR
jgi:hypothetical protein